jgi:N-methylhydantoinase B
VLQRDASLLDPVRLEVYRHLFTALSEEMGAALRRAAYSPNIKERRDYSCALFDADGRTVAMGDHMPVHLGAMPMSVSAALEDLGPLDPGDIALLNDPFRGGTHLPDLTLVAPVFGEGASGLVGDAAIRGHGDAAIRGHGDAATRRRGDGTSQLQLLAYLAVRAHHSDVGGIAAGSMPLAREIYQEGLRIPPVRLVRAGERVEDVWRIILANVRTPAEREGDLAAQIAALVTGERRLLDIAARRGIAETLDAMTALIEYGERMVERGLHLIPSGEYSAEDVVESDGFGGGPFVLRVRLVVSDGTLLADFTGSAGQASGGINAVAAITTSCVKYVVRCVVEALLGQTLPAGGGEMRSVRLVLPPRSIVAAELPASVAAGNVETSQRITDVLFSALANALPELIPAQSQGTMNNLTIGGIDPRSGAAFAYYETAGGGMGASPAGDGLSAVHVHMSNSLNTPIEALEHSYPFRVRRYEIRRGTGGAGLHKGGDGIRRDIEILADADVNVLSERRTTRPRGLAAGADGAAGENVLIRNGEEQALPSKFSIRVQPGDVLSLRTPGGGGWGLAES